MSFEKKEKKKTRQTLGHLRMQHSRPDMFGITVRTYLKTKIEIYELDLICSFELMRNTFTLREDHRSNTFKNRVLRIFWPKGDELRGWRKLHYQIGYGHWDFRWFSPISTRKIPAQYLTTHNRFLSASSQFTIRIHSLVWQYTTSVAEKASLKKERNNYERNGKNPDLTYLSNA